MDWWRSSMVETFGWMLVHSLWELAAIAAVVWVVLLVMRRASAGGRYWVCCAAMGMMVVAPVVTFVELLPKANHVGVESMAVAVDLWHEVPLTTVAPLGQAMEIGRTHSEAGWKPAILRYAVLTYLAGAAFLTMRLARGYWRLRGLRRQVTLADAGLREGLAALIKRWGMRRVVELVESALVEVPTVVGHLRPMILLPLTATSGLSAEQVAALMAHELAHVRRCDFLVNAIQSVIETLLFYHPAVWWISGRIREEREHCCDDMVVSLGTSRVAYAEALAEMESLRPATVLAMAANSTSLLPRIRRILQVPSSSKSRRSIGLLATILPAILITTLLAIAACRRHAPSAPPATQASTSRPGDTVQGAASDAKSKFNISIDTRAILVPDNFFDGTRNIELLNALTAKAGETRTENQPLDQKLLNSVIDNWSLNLLIKATQSDEHAWTVDLKRIETPDGQEVRLTSQDTEVALPKGIPPAFGFSFTVKPSSCTDHRYVALRLHDCAVSGGDTAKSASAIMQPKTASMVSVPDGGTLLLGAVPVEGNYLALFLLRPRLQPVENHTTSQPASTTQASASRSGDTPRPYFEAGGAEQLPTDGTNATSEINLKTIKRLEENITEISADHMPFEKVINFLRDDTATNIFVNWTALKEAGIDRDTPVTLNLHSTPFRKVLVTILAEVDGGSAELRYAIDDGVITISTKDDLESNKYQILRVYDVRDLLVQPDTNIRAPFGAPRPPATAATSVTRDVIIQDIIETITGTVAPNSWQTRGGKIGTIRELNGQLVISQTVDNHKFIYQLLNQLRESRALQIAVEARLVFLSDDGYNALDLPPLKGKKPVSITIDDKKLESLCKSIQANPANIVVDTPRVTLFNGQRGYIAVTEQKPYVAGCTSKPDAQGRSQPVYDTKNIASGYCLFLESTVSADRTFVVCKLHPTLRELVSLEKLPAPGMPSSPEFYVEKPVTRDAEFEMMCSIPDSETLAIAGLDIPVSTLRSLKLPKTPAIEKFLANRGPDAPLNYHLLLLIRPKMIIQKSIEMHPATPVRPAASDVGSSATAPVRERREYSSGNRIPDDVGNDVLFMDRRRSR